MCIKMAECFKLVFGMEAAVGNLVYLTLCYKGNVIRLPQILDFPFLSTINLASHTTQYWENVVEILSDG